MHEPQRHPAKPPGRATGDPRPPVPRQPRPIFHCEAESAQRQSKRHASAGWPQDPVSPAPGMP